MPPISRPFPRFVADASQEGDPYGRWQERLREQFERACEPLAGEVGSALSQETIRWFPARSFGARVYVPVTGRASEPTAPRAEPAPPPEPTEQPQAGEQPEPTEQPEADEQPEPDEPVLAEYFGHVSFEQPGEHEPSEMRAKVDFTDVTAEDNPDWRVDLNDDVIAPWYAEAGRSGDFTLIWGLPMVRGAVAVTAELDGEVLDQAPVRDGRFTLLAVDAIEGFGDPLYLEIRLWDRALREVASESLYAAE